MIKNISLQANPNSYKSKKVTSIDIFSKPCRILSKSAGFLPSKTPWPTNWAIQLIACRLPIRKWAFSFVAMKSKSKNQAQDSLVPCMR